MCGGGRWLHDGEARISVEKYSDLTPAICLQLIGEIKEEMKANRGGGEGVEDRDESLAVFEELQGDREEDCGSNHDESEEEDVHESEEEVHHLFATSTSYESSRKRFRWDD
jgi:hypothetical protein